MTKIRKFFLTPKKCKTLLIKLLFSLFGFQIIFKSIVG